MSSRRRRICGPWTWRPPGGEGGRSYRTLRDMREAVDEDGAYDVMVIDCPPNLSAACVSAILASDAVIIPVLSDACSATGVADLMEQIDSLRYIRPEIRVARGAGQPVAPLPGGGGCGGLSPGGRAGAGI